MNLESFGTALCFLEYDDECVTASETYSCGREKEPGIVNVIFKTEKGNATVVCNLCFIDPMICCKIFF
jgi:hypothetical protein